VEHIPEKPEDGTVAGVPCGLYQTTQPIGELVPAGALVYYHNHGQPGPGVYLVERWRHNKAIFKDQGVRLPDAGYPYGLKPLRPEGFYRVLEPFHCCARRCRRFEKDTLVQLGYNAQAEPLLFVPQWSEEGLALPERGTRIDPEKLGRLFAVKVEPRFETPPESRSRAPLLMMRGPDGAQ
jgi:hypothetical protein